jgi:hypothetical protein
MRAIIVAVAAGLAVAMGFGLNFATRQSATETSISKATLTPAISISVSKATTSKATTTPAISIWEIHNQAHLEFLPVQQFEDQSLVFAEKPR